jgi:Ca2+-dependent lipid-binding protein
LEANESADDSSAAEDLTERSRTVSKAGDQYGEIEMTTQYDSNRNKLIIKVNQARDLINTDKDSLSDAYVRFLLQPDKKKRTKRKTKVIKDSLNPQWEEQFEFDMLLAEAKTKSIDLMVKNEKSLFSREKTFMGQCLIPLGDIPDIENGNTSWYKLQHQSLFDAMVKKIEE